MALAILCSGQGRQHARMFALTEAAPEAAALFSHAAVLLGGRDPRELVRNEADDILHQNRVGQILCTLQALAATAMLGDALPARRIVAGYSIGELAAWGVAGASSHTDTLDLSARRAEIMDMVSMPGDGMLFVRGLADADVGNLCEMHGAAIAIVNPGNSFVIGGSRAALDLIAQAAKAGGATRVASLPIEVASHTPRLARASPAFREALRLMDITLPPITTARLLSGIDGTAVESIDEGLDKLAAQISRTVRWADCLQSCVEAGATAFLELGPGSALADMAAGAYGAFPARSLEEFRTVAGARAWLAKCVDSPS